MGTLRWDECVKQITVWDVALTDEEIRAALEGVSPLKIRPEHLKCYVRGELLADQPFTQDEEADQE